MTPKQLKALQLVLELAMQNMLSDKEVRGTPELQREQRRQEQACEVVDELISSSQSS